MGASARPYDTDNPFAQPAGVSLEPQNPQQKQPPRDRGYDPDNPFAASGETYDADNPFAASTIRHAPVVVRPDALPPAVVTDTAPSPAAPLQMPPVVVRPSPDEIAAAGPRPRPPVPAAQSDVTRTPASPSTPGTPIGQMDFVTRVAGALMMPVLQPVATAKGMASSLITANRAAAENEAASTLGMAGGDVNAVERTVSPEEAKNAAIQSATLLALPIAGEAEALLGSKLAPAVGSRLAGAVARTVVPAAAGAGLMPQDPLVGAVAGGIGGAAYNEANPFRPKVTRAITQEPGAMLPEETTPRAPTATGRVTGLDVAPEVPDFTVETNPPPAPAGLNITPETPAAPVEAPAAAAPNEPPPAVEAPPPPKVNGDVIFEDGAKRFVDARSRGGSRRPIPKVSTDGLVNELRSVLAKLNDAVRRSQYRSTFDDDVSEQKQVATRFGKGPSEQSKAFKNIADLGPIRDSILEELQRRGISDDEVMDRLGDVDIRGEERAGLAEDYNAGKINDEVVRDEAGNVLFSPRNGPTPGEELRRLNAIEEAGFSLTKEQKARRAELQQPKPSGKTIQQPTGETDLFGQGVTKAVPAQTSMFDENAGTKLAQEDAAKLAKHNEAISPEEMATRRDELGAPKQEIPGASEPDQGALFDRAGTAEPPDQVDAFGEEPIVDHGPQASATPQKGSGIAFTLRQMSERLSRALHHPIREKYFPFGLYKARGAYKPHAEVSRVIDLQDLDVAAHEAGHHIGKTYLGGLDDKETLKLLANHPGVESDLRRLGSDLYGPKAVDKHLQEGIAEVFKWYVVDPQHLRTRAPNALRWLENDIFPKEPVIAHAFQQARADFELYQKSPAQQKVAALYARHSIDRPIADIADAVKRFLRQKLTDDLGEFQQLEREGAIPKRAQDDPYLLAMATRTDGAWVTNALNYGIPSPTGRRTTVSYKSLLDRVPKGKATEYRNYLVAERLLEQASHELSIPDAHGGMQRVNDVLKEAPHLLNGPRGVVTRALLDKKIQGLTGGLESNPQGGTGKQVRAGLTFDEVRSIVEAGRKDTKLSAWAEDYWQFNHATLRLLSGHLLTPAEVSTILDANQKYVDFHRMFDGEDQGVSTEGAGRSFPKNAKGVSRLRGSSRSIGDPLESPVLALYRAARMVHKHHAFEAMVKLVANAEGLGHLIEEVHAPTDAIRLKITDEVAKQLKGMGLDPDDVDNLVGAQLVQYVARQFASGRDTRNMVLPALVKGKRRWYKIGDKRLWDAVQSMGAEEVPEWMRWLEIPARTLRAGTTLVPGFSVGTNWFRDAFDAANFSRGSSRPPFYHFVRGLFHMLRQDHVFHLFEQEGGDVSSQMLYDRERLPSKLRELSRNKALAEKTVVVRTAADWARATSELTRRYAFESWLRPLEMLASIPERATRIGETGLVYDQLLKKAKANAKASGQPLTDQDRIDIRKRAAAAGREVTLNFARGGTWVRQYNRLAVFLKPSIESIARFGRETGKSGKARSFTVLARMTAWIGVPAMIAYLMQRKDKDYQSTPAYMKNTGLVFIEHNDDGSFKRRWWFPIPNLEGWLFSVVPTRIMQWIDTQNPEALDEITTAFMETVKPSFTPTIAVPLIENDRNRSFFGNRPIEPAGLEELEPGYRATSETGETARLIGKKTNSSPAKIENLVRGYTGGLGEAALRASDKAVHAATGALGKPEEVNSIRDTDPLHTAPVVGRFARGQGNAMSSAWVQQFYDTWITNNEYRSTLIALRKAGRDDEADDYLEKHRDAIGTVATAEELHPGDHGAKPGPFREAHDALTKLRQRMDALSRDQLTPEEYRAQVAEANEQMLMVARRALEASGVRVMPAGSPEP